MEELDDLECLTIPPLQYLIIQYGQLCNEPVRDVEAGGRAAVEDEAGCGHTVGVNGDNADHAPQGFDLLPIKGKVVEVVPKVSHMSRHQ